MKKIIPIFLTLCLFLFVILLWLMAEDDNKSLKGRIDWYRNIKTPTKCEQTIKETCRVYEPEVIYKECVKRDCPVCEVVCEKCDYYIWRERIDTLNVQLREALLDKKLNCRQ